ncbi:MAG TPA: DegT/DnrJ/EryC1/StrS family aminotransferase [Phycisphaerales bacterium]|nr:DegT/DnrJ/EryC1/StrS family aminotransferase [Phycisphaerales bacterium]
MTESAVALAIPLSGPDITEAEIEAVVDTLRSGRLSIGPKAEEFERLVARRVNRPHAVAVSSGTAGLHLVLLSLGIGPGDEVITPAFSFVASANCVMYVGATPIFVDCDPKTLNMNVNDVEKKITPRTKAIIGVEVFGNPAGMIALASLAARHEIHLVEDSCEGLGCSVGKDIVGRIGRASVFGFYPNKQITTGEGGMIVTHDDHLANMCRSLRNQGRPVCAAPQPSSPASGRAEPTLGSWLSHERVGYNFRLSEINAALGVAQMNRLDEIIEMRQQVAAEYTRRLSGHPHIIVPTVDPAVVMSWFVYVVRLTDQFSAADRDSIIQGLHRHEIGASNYFPPIPLLPAYRDLFGFQPGDFPMAESVAQRTIALPFHNRLTEHDIDIVCQTLDLMIKRTTFARG